MKIVVEDAAGKEILNEKFCYHEDLTSDSFSSFGLYFKDGEEIRFSCEKEGELDELIDFLQEIREKAKKSNQN